MGKKNEISGPIAIKLVGSLNKDLIPRKAIDCIWFIVNSANYLEIVT